MGGQYSNKIRFSDQLLQFHILSLRRLSLHWPRRKLHQTEYFTKEVGERGNGWHVQIWCVRPDPMEAWRVSSPDTYSQYSSLPLRPSL